jgi:molybdopterin synthase catalytic subunit
VATEIQVRVRLFAAYREAAGGVTRLDETLPAGSRVDGLIRQLLDRVPNLASTKGLVAVNQEYVGPEFTLHQGDEVAFIPPVSGGADEPCSRS